MAHIRADSSDEEELITTLIGVAEEQICSYLNRTALQPWSLTQDRPPLAIEQAVLLHVCDLYENRSSQVEKALVLNPTVDRLLYPHRIGLGI
jgi:uncharacterized phage protein (predicted DNA packaging)